MITHEAPDSAATWGTEDALTVHPVAGRTPLALVVRPLVAGRGELPPAASDTHPVAMTTMETIAMATHRRR